MKELGNPPQRLMRIVEGEDSFSPGKDFDEMKDIHFIKNRIPEQWKGRRDVNSRTIGAISRSPKSVCLADCLLRNELEKLRRNYEDEIRLFPDDSSKENSVMLSRVYGGIVTLEDARARAYHLDAQSDAAMLVPTLEGGILFGESIGRRDGELSSSWKESVSYDSQIVFMGYAAIFGEKWQRRIYELGCAPLALYNRGLNQLQWCLVVDDGAGWEWPRTAES